MARLSCLVSLVFPSREEEPEPVLALHPALLPEQSAQPPGRVSLRAPGSAKTMCVVDDSPTVRAVLAMGLRRECLEGWPCSAGWRPGRGILLT